MWSWVALTALMSGSRWLGRPSRAGPRRWTILGLVTDLSLQVERLLHKTGRGDAGL